VTPVLVPARRFDPEWMDRTDNPREDLFGALDDIRSVNRFLGGSGTLLEGVRPFLEVKGDGAPLTILDVGTGGADLPLAMVACARSLGRKVRITAVDRDPATVEYARAKTADVPEIEIHAADAFELPFAPSSFDLVTASMFLHHFSRPDATRLIAGFKTIATRAVLINDLRRHVVPWAFIGLMGRITRRGPMFVHDAPLSVLRGFTARELLAIALDAGGSGATVQRFFPYRLLLTVPAVGSAP
jgi:SAM-dependent methyltransferase